MSNQQPWQTPSSILSLLEECGVADFIHADKDTPFLVEVAWLNYWNACLDDAPSQEGVEDCIAYTEGDSLNIEYVYQAPGTPETDAAHTILTLTPSEDVPGGYALQIIDGDQLIYYRAAWQDPATEWDINMMADDPKVTDERGNILFPGDHTDI